MLDCGIYRVISRRGSQSDEDTSSLLSQSMLEEERMKEFSFTQEEEQVEPGKRATDKDHILTEIIEDNVSIEVLPDCGPVKYNVG